MQICSIDGCGKQRHGNGFCGSHYQRNRRHGNPVAGKKYNGEGSISKDGYHLLQINKIQKPVHVLIVEDILEYSLPKGVIVHHCDGNPQNNYPSNLFICESQKEHMIYHQQKRAFESCGHALWRKCNLCFKYDDPINLWISKRGNSAWHRKCHREQVARFNRKKTT